MLTLEKERITKIEGKDDKKFHFIKKQILEDRRTAILIQDRDNFDVFKGVFSDTEKDVVFERVFYREFVSAENVTFK